MRNMSIVWLFVALLSACGATSNTSSSSSSSDTESSISDSAVSNASASGVSQLTSTLSTTDAGTTIAALAAMKKTPLWARIFNPLPNAYAALGSGGCSLADSDVTVTASCSDTDHTASVLIDYGAGCNVGENITITGKKKVTWANMGSSSCSSGASGRPKFWNAVQGTNATRTASTDPDNMTSPTAAIVRTHSNGSLVKVIGHNVATYSNYSSSGGTESVTETVSIPGTSRIKYKSDGTTKVFDHTVSTPTSLSILLQKSGSGNPTRTVQSGGLKVSHNLAGFSVTDTFSNVMWDYNTCDCEPTSGSISISVTDNTTGAVQGTGTVTFTYSTTGTCGSADLTYSGRAVSFPTLDRCR